MSQISLPFPANQKEIQDAVRDLFGSWGALQLWARCLPGCGWCSEMADERSRRRHRAAKKLAAFADGGR